MKIYFHTFGCKANQYDTEVIRQALVAAGASPTDDPAAADVAVVNSCTVTHKGEAKMRGLVRRLHRRRPEIRTIVMGCAAALDDGTIASLPGVTAVVGGSDPKAVLDAAGMDGPAIDPILRTFPRGARAWLKIQDGCDEHCTFCATTVARGDSRSRHPDEILAEAQVLSESHEEIVLTGVHIGTYGRDLAPPHSLAALVERLLSAIRRTRFRLTSVEATEVDERLMDLMATSPDRLAPHLHAPLQSGSDAILKRMGRHWYTARSYRDRCEALAERVPVLGLGADVIVGFPGETDADHSATRALIRDLPFTYLHVFPYSERPHASSARLGPPVDPRVVSGRAAELRKLASDKGAAHRARRSGGTADVVVLRRHQGVAQGLTEDYLDVQLSVLHAPGSRLATVLARDAEGRLFAEVA